MTDTAHRSTATEAAPTLCRPSAWKNTPLSLEGRRVLITGGTTGLGRTMALGLAANGADVLIFGRTAQHVDDALAACADQPGRVRGFTADLAEPAGLDAVMSEIDEKLGGLDLVINNAGQAAGSVTDTPEGEIREAIQVDLLAYMLIAKRVMPMLKRSDVTGGGMLIHIGSLSAKARGAGSDIYVAAKSALRGFSEALAKQVEEDGVRVSLIEPGKAGADIFKPDMDSPEMRDKHDDGKMLNSEAIAEGVLYVATQPRPVHVPLLQIQPMHQQVG